MASAIVCLCSFTSRNYEDFISYQTVNENLENYMKDIYNKRNNKNSSEKTTSYTDKNKIFSKNT